MNILQQIRDEMRKESSEDMPKQVCGIPTVYADMQRWANAIDTVVQTPIPMVLHCPSCGMQHIDMPEDGDGTRGSPNGVWNNPPHRSHLCHNCGTIWRPADVPTVGVEKIQTVGKDDKIALVTSIDKESGVVIDNRHHREGWMHYVVSHAQIPLNTRLYTKRAILSVPNEVVKISEVFVVQDETGQPVFVALWPEACHEHINDAINEHDIVEASKWKVLKYNNVALAQGDKP